MSDHVFPYRWKLTDGYPAKGIEPHGLKVFGTFICGGGSTMGYKLAGYHHLGGVEIDEKLTAIYERNHHPEMLYTEDLRLFNQREDLPPVLYDLDVLDGSPPCSTFSLAGRREKGWGKEKIFAEGQALQTLDDLVFVYCNTIKKLRPKTFILENVKGLAQGNAKSYLRRIFDTLSAADYQCQVFILNAASMGVPQMRERCFVIGRRKELNLPNLSLSFNEPPIVFGHIIDKEDQRQTLPPSAMEAFRLRKEGDIKLSYTNNRVFGKNTGFTTNWIPEDKVCATLTTGEHYLTSIPRALNEKELLQVGTFPLDYDYPNYGRLRFLVGMSVPPPNDCTDFVANVSSMVQEMKKYLIVATQKELELPAAKQAVELFGYTPIVTGVGGVNVIRRVRNLPREAYILNVGYVGSPLLPIGTEVQIGTVHSYHPGITFAEEATVISTTDLTPCYTAGDFVEGNASLPLDCVVDMELAYIAAFGFAKIAAVKYVSDNLDYDQYQANIQK